jgi:diguanylate cyclase (GGDEF)-like protein
VLDVDRFTNFNDVHGSVQGDQLLRAVAVCLSGLVPSSGLLVRNSGDEFAIVLENLAVDVAMRNC